MTNCVNRQIIWEWPSSEGKIWENLEICAHIFFASLKIQCLRVFRCLFQPSSVVSFDAFLISKEVEVLVHFFEKVNARFGVEIRTNSTMKKKRI